MIELLNPDVHAGAEITEPCLIQSVLLLEQTQGFPNDLAGRAVATTGDALLHEFLQGRRQRDVHEIQSIADVRV